jgi:transcriptional regulator with XRE-family HTH domain
LEIDTTVNDRISQVRQTFGYSQKKFGEGIKLSKSYLGEIEANKRKANDRIIQIICLTYGVNEHWLKTGTGTMFDETVDPRLEQVIQNFKKLDNLLKDHILQQLNFLVRYSDIKREDR